MSDLVSAGSQSDRGSFVWPCSGRDSISRASSPLDMTMFRETDIRSRIDTPGGMSPHAAKRIGDAFARLIHEAGKDTCVIGFDSREYSESIADAFALGLLRSGVNVVSIGLSTTPVLYFAQHYLGGIPGVSVTASHNPNGWAGLKLSIDPSATLGPSGIQRLVDIVDQSSEPPEPSQGLGSFTETGVIDAYLERVTRNLNGRRALKVVVDGGNSSSGPIAAAAISRAGHEVIGINLPLDWTFPNHEPDPERMDARLQIAEAVVAHGADIGLSFDGDGDRLGVTDDSGEAIWSDTILALLTDDVLARSPGAAIVFDVKSSRLVEMKIRDAGGIPVMWKTGHSHIKAKMRELSAPFAGERSGHFFDAQDYYGFDDAVRAGLRLLEVLSREALSLSATLRQLPKFFATPTMQASCSDVEKYAVVEAFAERAARMGAKQLVRVNGVRAEFEDGWFLVRASSNLPALVIVLEANTEGRLAALYRDLRAALSEDPRIAPNWENDPFEMGSMQ